MEYGHFQEICLLLRENVFPVNLSNKTLVKLQKLSPYDLILVGHYYSGQIRLAYLGAI
jgi:predicted MPP superfamily phosphohydrolase